MPRRIALLTLFTFVVVSAGLAQKGDESKPASPPASATCALGGGKTIKTDYSSPRLKGRKMIGEHDPYGKVWRAGANEATTFVTDSDLEIGGHAVPAGNYTIFAIPYADKPWILIINKKTGEWGIPYTYESDELARIPMKVSTLPSKVEDFTIAYDKTGNGCTLRMDWDTTRASVDITPK